MNPEILDKPAHKETLNYVGQIVTLKRDGVTNGTKWIVLRQTKRKLFVISSIERSRPVVEPEQAFELSGAERWTVASAAFEPETLRNTVKSLVQFIRDKEKTNIYWIEQVYVEAAERIMDLFDLLLDRD